MQFSTMACYAAIKSDANIDEAFKNMLIGLIETKEYSSIDMTSIAADFHQSYGIPLPYYPLRRLIMKLCDEGYIKKVHPNVYIPIAEKIKTSTFCDDYNNNLKTYKDLINSFYRFILNHYHDSDFNYSKCEEVINNFIEEFGINYYQYHNCNASSCYYLGDYLAHLQDISSELYNYFDTMIVGRILSELITYNEDTTKEFFKIGSKVYIDTGIALILFGIDNTGMNKVMTSLIQDIKDLGMSLHMYYHTYVETCNILSNSIHWINNPEYDPSKASESTYYFITNNYTRDQVEEFVVNFETNLLQYGVVIEKNIDYPQKLPRGVLDEATIYDKIVSNYQLENPKFDVMNKEFTLQNDAKSLFYTGYLGCGNIFNKIWDITHVFLTTNPTLAKIGREISIKNPMASETTIPFCVTDFFFGNLIWINTPAKLIEKNKMRINALILSAFNPSTSLLTKLNKSLIRLEALGTLTPEQCYLLKASKVSYSILMSKTHGDIDLYSDETPLQVLLKIQEDAKLNGVSEEKGRQKLNDQRKSSVIKSLQMENIDTNIQKIDLQIENINQKILVADGIKNAVEEKIQELLANKKDADKSVNKKIRNVKIIGALLIFVNLLLSIIFCIINEGIYFDFFQALIQNAIVLPVTYIYFCFFGKSLDVFKWTNLYKARKTSSEYKRFRYDLSTLKKHEETVQIEKNEIVQFYQQIDILMSKKGVLLETKENFNKKQETSLAFV